MSANGRAAKKANGGATERRLFDVGWEKLRRRIGAFKAVALILAVATFVFIVRWGRKRDDGDKR
ncbi:MAG: hypothetical protein IJY15_03420 [Thermoguttaceae bacterium]|nr:hypothetical protein [Thermoguttaceae bacterium]MBQ9126792.1 hypothetical protein [Thermoguttaceae bacterium]